MKAGDTIRHIKRNSTYTVLGSGTLAISPELLTDGRELVFSEPADAWLNVPLHVPVGIQSETETSEDTTWVLYRAHVDVEDVPSYWLRPFTEFSGRFEEM